MKLARALWDSGLVLLELALWSHVDFVAALAGRLADRRIGRIRGCPP